MPGQGESADLPQDLSRHLPMPFGGDPLTQGASSLWATALTQTQKGEAMARQVSDRAKEAVFVLVLDEDAGMVRPSPDQPFQSICRNTKQYSQTQTGRPIQCSS